jgi:hypothetical protein
MAHRVQHRRRGGTGRPVATPRRPQHRSEPEPARRDQGTGCEHAGRRGDLRPERSGAAAVGHRDSVTAGADHDPPRSTPTPACTPGGEPRLRNSNKGPSRKVPKAGWSNSGQESDSHPPPQCTYKRHGHEPRSDDRQHDDHPDCGVRQDGRVTACQARPVSAAGHPAPRRRPDLRGRIERLLSRPPRQARTGHQHKAENA